MSDQPQGSAAPIVAHCPACKQELPTADGWQVFKLACARSPAAHVGVARGGEFMTACGGWLNADTEPAPASLRKCKRCVALTTAEPSEKHPLQISER